MKGKRCSCGAVLAANADRCPRCGKRFTAPATIVLAILLGIAIVVILGSR